MATGFRLHDEGFVSLFGYLLGKLFEVLGEHVSRREKVVFVGERLLEPHQVTPQHVLLREVVDTWEVIGPLMRLHLLKHFDINGPVKPRNVPVGDLVLGQVEVEVELGHLLYHVVVSVQSVHYQTILRLWIDDVLVRGLILGGLLVRVT